MGFGCAVLPDSALGHVISASHIGSLLPAAAPPIGMATRLSLSVFAAILGAAGGFLSARNFAKMRDRQAPAGQDSRSGRGRRPIAALDELGGDSFDAPASGEAPTALRRRSLIARDEDQIAQSAYAADQIEIQPQPQEGPQWESDAAPIDTPIATGEGPSWTQTTENAFAFEDRAEPVNQQEFEPEPAPAESDIFGQSPASEPDIEADPGDQDALSFAAPSQAELPETENAAQDAAKAGLDLEPDAGPDWGQPAADGPVLPGDPEVDLGQLGMVHLAERLGHSLQNNQGLPATPPPAFYEQLKQEFAPAAADAATDEPSAEEPATAQHETAGLDEAEAESLASDQAWSEDALDESLVEAFEETPEAEPFAAPLSDAEVAPEVDSEIDPDIGPEIDNQTADLPPTRPQSNPIDLRPLSLHLDDFGEEEEEEEDDAASSNAYSSLLAMKQPARSPVELVGFDGTISRIDPAEGNDSAAGKGAAPDASGARTVETDRALRSALANLQRMSGAG